MADPICRWRNTSIKQLSEFTQVLPHYPMPKDEARALVEKQWHEWDGGNDFFRTPYQLAAQLGLYYEDDTMFYPRFDHVLTINEARQYIEGWIRRYYVPNPYTASIRYEGQPIILNSQLYQAALSGESDLDLFFQSRLNIVLGNKDILSNVLNNFSDIKVVNGKFSIKEEVSIKELISQNNPTDKKAFFETFNGILTDEQRKKESDNISRQVIYYGAPGTGKSHKIKEILAGQNVQKGNIFRTTFHPDSDYSTFVGAYKPTRGKKPLYGLNGSTTVRMQEDGKPLNEETITYNFIPQAFLNAYIRSYQTTENVYLIIEEINRGNCAQIFGDLFQLLDRDAEGKSEYTIKADTDLRAYLEETLGTDNEGIKDGEICLPSNLYIYATMNTSDQSLFPIDSAFKRRWDWEYEPIKYKNTDWVIDINGERFSWVSFQRIVNSKILASTNSEDKMLGDYFVNPHDKTITDKLFLNKVLFYLWNDVCKDGEGEIFKTSEDKEVSFSELYGDEGKQTLIKMMEYLGVEKVAHANNTDPRTLEDEEETTESTNAAASNGYDNSRYQINNDNNNGRGYTKSGVVLATIKYYCSQHPEMSANEVMTNWMSLNLITPNIVETVEVHEEKVRSSSDSRIENRTYPITLQNGDILYVSNQFNPERINDFMEKINAQNWGINIQKI